MILKSSKEGLEVGPGGFCSFNVQVHIILGALPTFLSFSLMSDMAFPFFIIVSTLLQTSFSVYCSGLLSSLETYTMRRVVAIASFFFLVIIFPSSSSRMSAQMSISCLPHQNPTLCMSSCFWSLSFASFFAHNRKTPSPWQCLSRR